MEVSNQIPEEDRKKIEDEAKKYRDINSKFVPDNQSEIMLEKSNIAGAEFGYTLGLQSAEKRVKELEGIVKEMLDGHIFMKRHIKAKAQQLLSK